MSASLPNAKRAKVLNTLSHYSSRHFEMRVFCQCHSLNLMDGVVVKLPGRTLMEWRCGEDFAVVLIVDATCETESICERLLFTPIYAP